MLLPSINKGFTYLLKYSAKFQINLIKDVAGVAGTRYESARAITPPKNGQNKNKKPHAHIHITRKQSIKFQINITKDVGGVVGARFRMDRRTDAHRDGQRSLL